MIQHLPSVLRLHIPTSLQFIRHILTFCLVKFWSSQKAFHCVYMDYPGGHWFSYEATSKIPSAAIIIFDFISEVDLPDCEALESTLEDISRMVPCSIIWGTEFLNTRKVVVLVSMSLAPSSRRHSALSSESWLMTRNL